MRPPQGSGAWTPRPSGTSSRSRPPNRRRRQYRQGGSAGRPRVRAESIQETVREWRDDPHCRSSAAPAGLRPVGREVRPATEHELGGSRYDRS